MENGEYTISCGSHTYVTLEWNNKFVMCLDNDCMKAEEIIYTIEKRTGMKFSDIQIKGNKEDFSGLLFFTGGWKRNFWEQLPSSDECRAYMNLKHSNI